MSDAAEVAKDVVADVAEEVADQAQAVADVVRSLTAMKVQYAAMGALVGAAAAGIATYFVTVRKLELKYNEYAAEEISTMREHYQDKVLALEEKPALEDIIAEKGYAPAPTPVSENPPMAVTPPASISVVPGPDDESDLEEPEEDEFVRVETLEEHRARVLAERDEAQAQMRNVFEGAEVNDEWDYHKEKAKRSPLRPYIIHVDEKEEFEHYPTITLTYYEGDDVLCNERDEIIDGREEVIGESTLNQFGHGSNDAHIVYVRNDKMQMQYEVVRSPNSFAEEVHGFPVDPEIRHGDRRRMRFDDDPPAR